MPDPPKVANFIFSLIERQNSNSKPDSLPTLLELADSNDRERAFQKGAPAHKSLGCTNFKSCPLNFQRV
ncbi:MAG: hypothetical protein DMG82_10185 [Acidobacteria bacterium]|nr:MAG: hypothetical protein DMG82_10185 [Acidobacteriota bacterium]